MRKEELLRRLRFPSEWMLLDMYPDELFEWQLASFNEEHEESPEHDRNGAFHWWLRREPKRNELENLLWLASIDSDPFLSIDIRQYIRKAKNFDATLAKIDEDLFATRL
jgi:hypothetical protein